MVTQDELRDLMVAFLEDTTQRLQRRGGQPEAQLAAPADRFLCSYGRAAGIEVALVSEATAGELRIRPDHAVYVDELLVGYVELKAPGKGADPARFTDSHDCQQWSRLKEVPNLIYTDGTRWALFRYGLNTASATLPDTRTLPARAPSAGQVAALDCLLRDFLGWQPVVPSGAEQLAEVLAPLCRLVRDAVLVAVRNRRSALTQLAQDWRQVLFPEANDAQFADAYAQTLTYALLLARLEPVVKNGRTLTASRAAEALDAGHSLLAQALRVLADPYARAEIEPGVALLERAIGAVDAAKLAAGPNDDVWLYFYEHFLGAYDANLRAKRGVYYTPVEAVHCQIRLISQLLAERLQRHYGYADDGVVLLDPAAGTGTYLLAAIDHGLETVRDAAGPGAIPGRASVLAENIHGFEILVGPYTVAHLRVTQRLRDAGAKLPSGGVHVYLTDTLESPELEPARQIPLFLRRLGDEHERARRVRTDTRVLVCVGNPPYNRQAFAERARAADSSAVPSSRLLGDFLELARGRTMFSHLASLYNDYVYFWRWALWKVFESKPGPGIVSFITASSYLDAPGFVGMREVMRRVLDELWIIDLEGDSHGAMKTDNIFAIRTPVAIAIGVRQNNGDSDTPAKVHYARVAGSRKEKLRFLDSVHAFRDIMWQACPEGWGDPFRPADKSTFQGWPLLTEIFPWQQPGVKAGRTWPIATIPDVAEQRWDHLTGSDPEERSALFADRSYGRSSTTRPSSTVWPPPASLIPLSEATLSSPKPRVVRYAHRSFDRKWILADSRLLRTPSQPLWATYSEHQVFLTTLLTGRLGPGPAATVAAHIPDLHHFSGRGGKDVIPLWRDASATEPNVTHGLLDRLAKTYGRPVAPGDLLAYCYALLAGTSYTRSFAEALRTSSARIPFTFNAGLFAEVVSEGHVLLRLHTFGERFVPPGEARGRVPVGIARAIIAIDPESHGYPDKFYYEPSTRTLHVGVGTFVPVSREVWELEVSGLRPLRSWLRYRMREPAGRKSSPLDDIRPERWPSRFTDELLELLWVLEATVAMQPRLAQLLERVLGEALIDRRDLPVPDRAQRRPPVPQPVAIPRLGLGHDRLSAPGREGNLMSQGGRPSPEAPGDAVCRGVGNKDPVRGTLRAVGRRVHRPKKNLGAKR